MLSKQRLISKLPYLLISTAVLLAWFPSLKHYAPIADDHALISVYENGLGEYFRSFGIWRILGHAVPYLTTITHPYFHSVLALGLHLATACCFYKVAVLLLESTSISFVLALIMGVFPWGYQAMLMGSSLQVVIHTLLFLVNLIILLSLAKTEAKHQFKPFIISFLVTLLSLLAVDYLFFALLVSGVILWLPKSKITVKAAWNRVLTFYAGLAPVLGCAAYLILYKTCSAQAVTAYKQPFFNPPSIFAVYYRQYSNLDIFQPWLNQTTRDLLFFQWGASKVAVALLLGTILLIGLIMFSLKNAPDETNGFQEGRNKLIYILFLLIGASSIYALTGGYSLDSRKKYPLIPLMLMLLGWIWRSFFPVRSKISINRLYGLLPLILLGVSTTWLVIGIWRFEVARSNSLILYLAQSETADDVRLVSDIDVYSAWPTMERTLGFRLDHDWVLNLALERKGIKPIRVSRDSSVPILRFDRTSLRWEKMYLQTNPGYPKR